MHTALKRHAHAILVAVGLVAISGALSCNNFDADDRETDAYVIPTLAPAFGHEANRDCSDFHTWQEAQDFYERSGPGDPHHLDRDGDGIACDVLRPNTNEPDRDCRDFRTWREAQDFFERSGSGDPHYLDADGDGIACETLQSNSRFLEYDRPDLDFIDFDDSDYDRPYRP